MKQIVVFYTALVGLFFPGFLEAKEKIYLPNQPSLSPDGQTLLFSWRGDVWCVPTQGGDAKRLTRHPGTDMSPCFSPNGKEIAFISNRGQGTQIYIMPKDGGEPVQLTHHSEGYNLEGWYPDGSALLANAIRDHFWKNGQRFFQISLEPGKNERLLFDDYGRDGSISPDGKRLLFTREGEEWWRKGYRGSRSSQIWQFEVSTGRFQKIIAEDTGARWPIWKTDGKGFYYVSGRSGSFNLWEYDFGTTNSVQLTTFDNDVVAFPCLSKDGKTMVFRYLFDLYAFHPGSGQLPVRIELWDPEDTGLDRMERKAFSQASEVAFTDDGLEIAFVSGGDLWVMDTELKEPKQVTNTAAEERMPVFGADGQLFFVSETDGHPEIWQVEKSVKDRYWWQNDRFNLLKLTDDRLPKNRVRISPDGLKLAYITGSGNLNVLDLKSRSTKTIIQSWNPPEYEWSPDGKWFAYAMMDKEFNSDIWIQPSDGSEKPINVSRHPYNESNPVWSPDGRLLAFTGLKADNEIDIGFVWLKKSDDDKNKRDRTLEKALEKINKIRKKKDDTKPASKSENAALTSSKSSDNPAVKLGEEPGKDSEKPRKKLPEVVIDFEDIHERVRQVAIPNTTEDNLFWSHDSKKLAFTATIDGKRGTYTIEIPEDLKPKLLSSETGSHARWIEQGNQIVWLANGTPASMSDAGKATTYGFRVLQVIKRELHFRAGFDAAWRAMRDGWYDERLGNRNWDDVYRKYVDAAAQAPDMMTFTTVLQMMLGELNGSHLGFMPSKTDGNPSGDWNIETSHLGVRFDLKYKGPGLKVRDVLPSSPLNLQKSRVVSGEIIVSIDGVAVDIAMDLTKVLNGIPGREIKLKVKNHQTGEREAIIHPINFSMARQLLYQKWIRDNRELVTKKSEDKIGYLHIKGMDWPSFRQFEHDLYAAGAGKEGLIIDVRENGGGFTADHLLTALCQPLHAITVPRGGEPGYPQDRKVYATWNKPIVVLCNQNSFSNAEIFSHAIKGLKRGKLVGVATAGGVISTGARTIMDLGTLRMPSRGWFVPSTGEDMELNGAKPDYSIWPQPGQMPLGKDIQLEKAVQVLQSQVVAEQKKVKPVLRKASERNY